MELNFTRKMHFLKSFGFCLAALTSINICLAQTGITWNSQTSAVDNNWSSVAYGNNLFVAVGFSGTGNRVMTSPDGATWTTRSSAADNTWVSVAYGNGLFVAVATTGTNRVMTSTDGITWTGHASAAEGNQWSSVTYGNGLFVAVSINGDAMTSPDGINWTLRPSGISNQWYSVTYGNSLFVAVGISGVGNRVMTSPDGITWTARSSAADNSWTSVTCGNSLFVAVSLSGTGNRVMTSPDGITWTPRASAADNAWRSVVYGDGLFVAVSGSGVGNRVMTSPDGIIWTSRSSAADNYWRGVTYANGIFVAVSQSGTGNRVMTSGTFSSLPVHWVSFTAKNSNGKNTLYWQTASETNNALFEIERSRDGRYFTRIGELAGSGNTEGNTDYTFTDLTPAAGTNFYRLKQVDANGKFEYSKVVVVNTGKELSFSFYPNPVHTTLVITGLQAGKVYSYAITNFRGQTVSNGILQENGEISLAALPKGIYNLSVNGVSKQFVKQ